ncbi:MAG: hypothetical protein DI540_25785 [Sphingobium sp.]|nr:MAG: hypothetical protein DI540_25785 [Sphingobium sp.]
MQRAIGSFRLPLEFALTCTAFFSPALAQSPEPLAIPVSQAGWFTFSGDTRALLAFNTELDGHTADAVADTGVTFTSIDRAFAVRFWPDTITPPSVAMSASGGTAAAALGPVVDIALPTRPTVRRRAIVTDHTGISSAAGHPVNVLLGMDVIGQGSLELDLANKRWRFGDTGMSWLGFATVPIRYSAGRYLNYVEIDVEGRPLHLAVDTGYDGGLMLTTQAAVGTGLLRRGRITTIAIQGLGGLAVTQMLIPSNLRIGKFTLSDLEVQIDDGGGLPTKWRLDGLVGLNFLRRFHIALDYPAGTMAYTPTDLPVPKAIRSTIGVQALPDGDGLAIVHVMANSPAARAGWTAGGRICAVDGIAIDNSPQHTGPNPWNVAPAGTRVSFRFCDGSTKVLTARNFY